MQHWLYPDSKLYQAMARADLGFFTKGGQFRTKNQRDHHFKNHKKLLLVCQLPIFVSTYPYIGKSRPGQAPLDPHMRCN